MGRRRQVQLPAWELWSLGAVKLQTTGRAAAEDGNRRGACTDSVSEARARDSRYGNVRSDFRGSHRPISWESGPGLHLRAQTPSSSCLFLYLRPGLSRRLQLQRWQLQSAQAGSCTGMTPLSGRRPPRSQLQGLQLSHKGSAPRVVLSETRSQSTRWYECELLVAQSMPIHASVPGPSTHLRSWLIGCIGNNGCWGNCFDGRLVWLRRPPRRGYHFTLRPYKHSLAFSRAVDEHPPCHWRFHSVSKHLFQLPWHPLFPMHPIEHVRRCLGWFFRCIRYQQLGLTSPAS